ncbi:hypothetical protein C2U70_14560 [Bradyrhizobium guangdongense]|nr:hypothetical protein C2U70_14560 [Bradyrhizobium guangdongense]
MAGLGPAIHDLCCRTKNVDARDKPGHDEFVARACRTMENVYAIALPASGRGSAPSLRHEIWKRTS